jgi:hypothetical protein
MFLGGFASESEGSASSFPYDSASASLKKLSCPNGVCSLDGPKRLARPSLYCSSYHETFAASSSFSEETYIA